MQWKFSYLQACRKLILYLIFPSLVASVLYIVVLLPKGCNRMLEEMAQTTSNITTRFYSVSGFHTKRQYN